MKVLRVVLISLLVIALLVTGSLLRLFWPFLRMSQTFTIAVEDQQTIVRNELFGVQFRVNDSCVLKNQYTRYHKPTIWDAILICDKGDEKNVLHLYIRMKAPEAQVRGMPNHNGSENIFNDESIPESNAIFVTNKGSDLILTIRAWGYPKSWPDMKETIRAY